ncbi:MAG: DUF1684 domain-containing protein [Caldilineaceae bacterium]|nr:DUF1684 domain-containing protein [Caldilineaceae bacterium]
MTDEVYYEALTQMRRQRAEAIAADRSWLTLAGLYWLQPGENSFGAGHDNAIVLPANAGVAQAGAFSLADGTVTLHVAPDAPLQLNGHAAAEQALQHDLGAAPDLLTLGPLSMIVIKRGDRYGIRLYDSTNPRRQAFTGLDWYAIAPAYRIEARFVPYEPAKVIRYGTVLGDQMEEACPGAVHFTWQGVACRLDAQQRGAKLFFNFRDATNGDTTYGAGRFLYSDAPRDGTVLLDFNLATNPYCAYTAYATCPLPPAQNRLPVRIEAGERQFPQSGEAGAHA